MSQRVSPKNEPLSAAEAEASREKYGRNELSRHSGKGFWQQFLANFGDPIIKILLIALAVNVIFLFRSQNWAESAGIAAAVLLAVLVSTLSEYGSEAAFSRLQEEAERLFCLVMRREGIVKCPLAEVVVGDWVLLQAGERVPADGVLIKGALTVDQSALTGESRERRKRVGSGKTGLDAPGRMFRGEVIAGGEGMMRVESVGDATVYGQMAHELQERSPDSPLKKRLAGLARSISRLGYSAAALVAAADLFHALVMDNQFDKAAILATLTSPAAWGEAVLHALTLAITVVVVAVPEGLPMMITVVLSSQMRRMLRDHVLVRKPVGIETSGSLQLLLCDKTGTLTKGQLEVIGVADGAGKVYPRRADLRQAGGLWQEIEACCRLNSEAGVVAGKATGGNATDRALLRYVMPLAPGPSDTVVRRTPFSSDRRYAAVQTAHGCIYIKGAPEKLLPACTHYIDAAGVRQPIGLRRLPEAIEQEWTNLARRVLVLARGSDRLLEPFADLTLLGLVAIQDDVRPEAPAAVAELQQAGIQMVMVTGDNRETAAAIAAKAGLLAPGTPARQAILTGSELELLRDDAVKERLPQLRVVARARPADKSRLVRLGQECGLVVGMTGDGLNDAPALKKSEIGFAMGSGTEVAKEAGDMVILDDNIASIARAVLYGRTVFLNIQRFIVFQLTMNLCAVGVSLIGPFIGIETPVTVMQMLWINMIMDTLAGLAFAGEPPLPEYMEQQPKRLDEPVLSTRMLGQILFTGLYTVALCLAFLKIPWSSGLFGGNDLTKMTAFFALFVFCGIFNSFNARTPRCWLLAHLRKNKPFAVIMAVVAAVQIAMIYYGGTLFRAGGLSWRELFAVMAIAFTVIPIDLLRKVWLSKRAKNQ